MYYSITKNAKIFHWELGVKGCNYSDERNL